MDKVPREPPAVAQPPAEAETDHDILDMQDMLHGLPDSAPNPAEEETDDDAVDTHATNEIVYMDEMPKDPPFAAHPKREFRFAKDSRWRKEKNVQEAWAEMMEKGRYTDHLITCRGDKHRVHKAILLSHSGYFRAQLYGDWAEAAENVSDFPNDRRQDTKEMISFFYTGHYGGTIDVLRTTETPETPIDPWPPLDKSGKVKTPVPYPEFNDDFTRSYLVLDVRMAEVGQRLRISHLCDYAASQFVARCKESHYFFKASERCEFRAALYEAEQLLDENSTLSRELVDIAVEGDLRLFSDISMTKCREYAPCLMDKIISLVTRRNRRESGEAESDEESDQDSFEWGIFTGDFGCPHCHKEFKNNSSGMVAGWLTCPECGWGAELDHWKAHCGWKGGRGW